jgi:uncharacterized protein with HEPN domain
VKAGARRDRFLVSEMLRHADVMAEVVRRGREEFDRDRPTRYAVEHAVELFAEAAEKLSGEFERANPGIPWRGLRPLRRDVAHPYDPERPPVDPDRVWRFVAREVPAIVRQLQRAVYPSPSG